jgi:hypothetical protein
MDLSDLLHGAAASGVLETGNIDIITVEIKSS